MSDIPWISVCTYEGLYQTAQRENFREKQFPQKLCIPALDLLFDKEFWFGQLSGHFNQQGPVGGHAGLLFPTVVTQKLLFPMVAHSLLNSLVRPASVNPLWPGMYSAQVFSPQLLRAKPTLSSIPLQSENSLLSHLLHTTHKFQVRILWKWSAAITYQHSLHPQVKIDFIFALPFDWHPNTLTGEPPQG